MAAARRGRAAATPSAIRRVERLVSAPRANRASCGPRPSRWGPRWSQLATDLGVLDDDAIARWPSDAAPVTLPGGLRARRRRACDPARGGAHRLSLRAGSRTRCSPRSRPLPLGQVAGQRLLARAGRTHPAGSSRSRRSLPDDDIASFASRAARLGIGLSRNPVFEVVPLMNAATRQPRPLRVGIGGPVGSGKTALTLALCQALRDRYQIAVVTNDIYTDEDAQFLVRNDALAARAHHRRRDRRLPAYGDPRGRLDQPRGRRPAHAALRRSRPDLRRKRRRQSRRDLLPGAVRPHALRDRRRRRRQDPAQGRAGHHALRPAGHQQDRPRAARSAHRSR